MRSGVRRSGFSGSRFTAAHAFFCVLTSALAAHATDILSGRLYTVPEKIYVQQAFEIHFELETTVGAEVEDLRISDFPNDPKILSLGRLEPASRTSGTRDGQAIHVLHFMAQARGLWVIEQTFNPRLQCSLVQRRSVGFFSQWQSSAKQLQLAPFTLRILPLPAAGRPENFGGAVGSFRLAGRLSANAARPGDIITLTLDLTGQGWLNESQAPLPPASPLFKTYPAKEKLREPQRIQTEQVFIPQATNATEIAAARFCFFNPEKERYEECVAGPFKLTISDASSAPKAEEVRVIDTARPSSSEAAPQADSLELVHMTLRQALPLLVGSAGAIAAFFVFFLLYGRHTRLAFVCGAALLAAGIGAGYATSGKADVTTRQVSKRAEVLFAPSRAAAALFSLNPGAAVTPLETAGAWVRIDAAGRRGWIPAESLSSAAADTPRTGSR